MPRTPQYLPQNPLFFSDGTITIPYCRQRKEEMAQHLRKPLHQTSKVRKTTNGSGTVPGGHAAGTS
jgi:hypothetical protein